MKTLAYETPRGTLKVVRGEWIDAGNDAHVFKTEDNKYIELIGNSKLVMTVRTRNGGHTGRTIGYVA